MIFGRLRNRILRPQKQTADEARRSVRVRGKEHPPPPEGRAERAGYKVQVPNIASKAFLSLKSLALKTYPKASLKGRLEKLRLRQASPHPKVLPPRPAHTAKNPGKKFLWPFLSIFGSSKWQSKFGFEKITKKVQNSRI